MGKLKRKSENAEEKSHVLLVNAFARFLLFLFFSVVFVSELVDEVIFDWH